MKNIGKKIHSLNPNEQIRIDSSKRSLLADGIKAKKKFLENEAKLKIRRDKIVNKERRRFLDMVSKAGVSGSLLKASSLIGGIFSTRHALAQDSNKNVIFVYASQGAEGSAWLPGSAGNMNWISGPYGDYGVAGITNFRQVNVFVQGHASARQSMGDPQPSWHLHKPTMDERIADVLGATSPYSTMYLGSNATMGMNRGEALELMTCSSLGTPIDSPQDAFNRFFNAAPPIREDLTYETLFDSHQNALTSIRNKLGQEEKERIDKHGEALQKIEDRLAAASMGDPIDLDACKPQNLNFGHDTITGGKAQADILVAALQCGLTHVATLQIGDNKAYYNVPDTGHGAEVHGGISHGNSRAAFNDVMRYHQEVPAYLIKRLMETDGPDGNKLIDNTVVAVVNCMGDGMSHGPENAPFALATRMSGFKNTFSAGNGGSTFDFHGAIPRGLGIESLVETDGSDDSLLG